MEKPVDEMTDLEFVDHWIDKCSAFVNPILFRELKDRGLTRIVNLLEGTIEEKRAQARARMAYAGHYVGEPEIEEIAGHINRVKVLQAQIFNTHSTDVKSLIQYNNQMKIHLDFINDYFKKPAIP